MFLPSSRLFDTFAAAAAAVAIVVCLGTAIYCDAISLQLADERWKEYHYKIYATVSAPQQIVQLEPSETLAMLQELDSIYGPFTEEQTNGRKFRVQVLLEAADVSLLNCHRDRFVSYEKLLDYNEPYKLNLVPYIEHYRQLQYNLCLEHVIDLMYYEINNNLRPQYREDMQKLTDLIASTSPEKEWPPLGRAALQAGTPEEYLVAGIVEFLRLKLGFLDVKLYKERPNGRMRFYADLDTNVFAMCKAWVGAMDPVFTMLEMEAPLALSPKESEWLLYSDICRNIFKMAPEIYKGAYKRIRRMPTTKFVAPKSANRTASSLDGVGEAEKQALARIWHKPNYHGREQGALGLRALLDSSLLAKFWRKSKQTLQCKLMMKKSC